MIYLYRRSRYEYVRDGCATGSKACPHADPITVYALNRRGHRMPGGTVCIDRSKSTEALYCDTGSARDLALVRALEESLRP